MNKKFFLYLSFALYLFLVSDAVICSYLEKHKQCWGLTISHVIIFVFMSFTISWCLMCLIYVFICWCKLTELCTKPTKMTQSYIFSESVLRVMSTGFSSATFACHKHVMQSLYEYLAPPEEVNGLVPQKTLTPVSVYVFDPMCITHFIQMLEFYHTNSIQDRTPNDYFKKQLIKEGITTPQSYLEITDETIISWMDECQHYYKTNNMQKLCVASNIQLLPLNSQKFNYNQFRAKLNSDEQTLTDYFNEILQPKENSPSMPGLAVTKIPKLDAFIVFKKEETLKEHQIGFKNIVNDSFSQSTESQQFHEDFIENLLKQTAKPFFYMIHRICFLKNKNFTDPYELSSRKEPTIIMGLEIVKTHRYDMTACFFSFQILWNFFLSMIVSSGIMSKKNELVSTIGVDYSKISNPQYAIGFVLKDMKKKKAYKRFLVMEFFPLMFYMNLGKNDIVQKINHAILKGKKNSKIKSYYEDGLQWTSYSQRISFLNYMDNTIDAKLQFLSMLQFTKINYKEDTVVNMFDSVLFEEMKYFHKTKLLDLDESFIENVTLPKKLHMRDLNSIFLSHLCTMLRYVTMQLERSKLWNLEIKQTPQTSKLEKCIIYMLRNMPLCLFYNKNNTNIHERLKKFQQEHSMNNQFYDSVKKYISHYDCNNYPFFGTISSYTHASHVNSVTTLLMEFIGKHTSFKRDNIIFENTDNSHFVFNYKENRLRFNIYYSKNFHSSQKKITLDGYSNTLPKHVVIEAAVIQNDKEFETYSMFVKMVKEFATILGGVHTILNRNSPKNPKVLELFPFNGIRFKHISESFLYTNRFDILKTLMMEMTHNRLNINLDHKIFVLKERFCNDIKKPWKSFNLLLNQFYQMLNYRAIVSDSENTPIFKQINQNFDLIVKTDHFQDVLVYSYPLSKEILYKHNFMILH